MVFHTQTGSSYEVDFEGKRVRCLGRIDKTASERLPPDSAWREYVAISDIELGKIVVIQWGDNVKPLFFADMMPIAKITMTSPVKEVA